MLILIGLLFMPISILYEVCLLLIFEISLIINSFLFDKIVWVNDSINFPESLLIKLNISMTLKKLKFL